MPPEAIGDCRNGAVVSAVEQQLAAVEQLFQRMDADTGGVRDDAIPTAVADCSQIDRPRNADDPGSLAESGQEEVSTSAGGNDGGKLHGNTLAGPPPLLESPVPHCTGGTVLLPVPSQSMLLADCDATPRETESGYADTAKPVKYRNTANDDDGDPMALLQRAAELIDRRRE